MSIPLAISVTWILQQVDMLLSAAKTMPPGAFRDAIERRAEVYLDLVENWKVANGGKR